MTIVRLVPPKLVEIDVDGRWHRGELRAWQKLDGRWRGDVLYTVGVGLRKLGWFDEDRLRESAASP